MPISIIELAQKLRQTIETSYAHNSYLYRYLDKKASLKEVVQFLHWDAQQISFKAYLEGWLSKTPEIYHKPLLTHIDEEADHAILLNEMMAGLYDKVDIELIVNAAVIENVNYTFSLEAVAEQSFEYFIGGLFATELMSHKRYGQLLEGFKRLGISKDQLYFIDLHYNCDETHSMSVLEDIIIPRLIENENHFAAILRGLLDRLSRSEKFLLTYEESVLNV